MAGRAEIAADVAASTFAQTTFLYRPVGTDGWRTIGTDDNAPFRVFHDVSGMPLGTVLEYRAVVKDAAGRVAARRLLGAGRLGSRRRPRPRSVTPSPSRRRVGPRDAQLRDGLPRWASTVTGPGCDQAQLALDADDQIWKKSFSLPAAPYSYKAAIDRSWTENYGDKGVLNGANISYETDGTVTFYYDHATHWATSDEETTIVTVPGSFQSELGCPADWQPDCMRPWLQDKDGDGVFAWATTKIPAGTWEFKVAHGLSWDESYGNGSGNITVTVPVDGAKTTFVYDSTTHRVTVSSDLHARPRRGSLTRASCSA